MIGALAFALRIKEMRMEAEKHKFWMVRYIAGKTTCEASSQSVSLAERQATKLSKQHGEADLCEITDDNGILRMGACKHYEDGKPIRERDLDGKPLQPVNGTKAVKMKDTNMAETTKVEKSEKAPKVAKAAKPVKAAAKTATTDATLKRPAMVSGKIEAIDHKKLRKLTVAEKKALLEKFAVGENFKGYACKLLCEKANEPVSLEALANVVYGATEAKTKNPQAILRVLDGVEASIQKLGIKASLEIASANGAKGRILIVK